MGDLVLLDAVKADGQTLCIGQVTPDEHPGSLTSEEPGAIVPRRLFLFGWWRGECGVWESDGGLDFADATTRTVLPTGVTKLSDLTDPHELTVHRPGRPPFTVRISMVREPPTEETSDEP